MNRLLVCPGGYHQIADEAGNASTAGLLALARLTRGADMEKDGAAWLAVLHGLQWGEELYQRLELCRLPCKGCPASCAAAILRGDG